MSTFTDAQKIDQPSLDGANDLRPEVETTLVRKLKAKPKRKLLKKPLPLNNHVSTIKTTRIN